MRNDEFTERELLYQPIESIKVVAGRDTRFPPNTSVWVREEETG
jgi:hypothetical protein